MRALVLGAYGLIGLEVVRELLARGHDVTGLGRHPQRFVERFPQVQWLAADLAELQSEAAWRPLLSVAAPEVIVNCAGALQDGLRDSVVAVQREAMLALYLAAKAQGEVRLVVQVSATRANNQAENAFMRTKAEADAALQDSGLAWAIVRPGLVLAPQAYGGTALLRALAACPLVLPLVYADRPIQTIHVADVAAAVADLAEGRVAANAVYDLVEDEPQRFVELVRAVRAWLGFPRAYELAVPSGLVHGLACMGDAAGWLGWRAPLRTTAMQEIAAGITGDPEPWRLAAGRGVRSLAASLDTLPSTVQERWFARAFLLKAPLIGVLALFWLFSGVIALLQGGPATLVLTERGLELALAQLMVYGGALVDIALGIAICWRPLHRLAALGMLAVTFAYLLGGTLFAPDLWLDPLGPLLKPLALMLVPLTLLALAEER